MKCQDQSKKSNKHLDDVISELRNEEDRLLDEKEKYSHDLYILKEFTTTKVKMLTENINNEFEIAEFKLFNTLVNGELEEHVPQRLTASNTTAV